MPKRSDRHHPGPAVPLHAIGRWIWELPAGSLKPGEDPDGAAARECHEEIGLVPADVERMLGSFYPTPGFCDEEMHLLPLRSELRVLPAADSRRAFFSFCLGRMTSFMPSRRGQHLLLDAADRQHRPDRVISPVIATSPRTGRPEQRDASAVTIVTPADGPSFGIAPAGTWRCTSASL
jgi:hypothetical protein